MKLSEKIKSKSSKVGVIGLGYVGLPLAFEFANNGFNVTGFDVDEEKVNLINHGSNYIPDIDDHSLNKVVKNKNLYATSDFSAIKHLDCISICVPTPLNKSKDPDISYIVSVMEKIEAYLHPDLLITLESTTYPGTTREVILHLKEPSPSGRGGTACGG